MRALQTATLAAVAASATPAPSLSVGADRQALAHMIKNNQVPLAFETVSIWVFFSLFLLFLCSQFSPHNYNAYLLPIFFHIIVINNTNTSLSKALNQGDQAALEFVCNNVDPDELFRYPSTLSQPVLLSLLQQLSLRLDSDTDLKFR